MPRALALCLALALPAAARANTQFFPPQPPPGQTFIDEVALPDHESGFLWHRVRYTAGATEQVSEYLPAGQNLSAWTQIITVKTLPLSRNPRQIVNNTVDLLRAVCTHIKVVATKPTQDLGQAAGLDLAAPAFESAATLVTCDEPDTAKLQARIGTNSLVLKRHEVTWYKLITGPQSNYIVQRAWHADTIDETSPLGSDMVLNAWKRWITHVTLKRHPAPK